MLLLCCRLLCVLNLSNSISGDGFGRCTANGGPRDGVKAKQKEHGSTESMEENDIEGVKRPCGDERFNFLDFRNQCLKLNRSG